MAITPTILIAAKGLVSGDAIQGNLSAGSPTVARITDNPVFSTFGSLPSEYTPPAWLQTSLLGTLQNAGTQLSTVQAQSSNILPPGNAGARKFASVFGQSAGFGAAGAEWGAALKEFRGKSFSDLSPNFSKISDINTNGLTGMFSRPNIPVMPGTTPGDLLKTGFSKLGESMKGFGTMFDAGNISAMSDPRALINNLRSQQLSDIGGIEDRLYEAGIEEVEEADPETLRQILSEVKGEDLKRIMKQTGFSPSGEIANLSQVLDSSRVLPGDVIAPLPGGDLAGLANGLGNLGGNFRNFDDIANTLKAVDVPDIAELDNLDKPLPDNVYEEFKDLLGSGDGPYGNPTMGDFLGSVSGKGHSNAFGEIGLSLQKLTGGGLMGSMLNKGMALSSAVASARSSAISIYGDPDADGITDSERLTRQSNIKSYIDNDVQVKAANSDINSLRNSFENSSEIASLKSKIDQQVEISKSRSSLEASNLSKGAIDLEVVPKSNTAVLGIAAKLHDFGVDKMNLGFGDMFAGMCQNNMYGEAIQAALKEGRTRAKMVSMGCSMPGTSDADRQAKETAMAQVDSVRSSRDAAKAEYEMIQSRVDRANRTTGTTEAMTTELELARERYQEAQGKCTQVERTAGVDFS